MERGILCGDNIKESGDKGQGKPCLARGDRNKVQRDKQIWRQQVIGNRKNKCEKA